jgi:hypothetical protein
VSKALHTLKGPYRPSPLRTFVTGRYEGELRLLASAKIWVSKNLKLGKNFATLLAMRVKLYSRKRFNCSLDDGVKEGSLPNSGSRAMPVTDDLKLTPLAVLAVNSLMDTYKHRGPDAFDDDALILFLAVGSIIARTRGPEGLHDEGKLRHPFFKGIREDF